MNLSKPLRTASRLFYSLFMQGHGLLPRQQSSAFASPARNSEAGIGPIFVINLDRQPVRWTKMRKELDRVIDADRKPLSKRVVRFSACDALADAAEAEYSADVDPYYTLADQLFVEPQPSAAPDKFDLERPIRMSDAEVAVAHSHINVWKKIAQSEAAYTIVLEDDVWFDRGFGKLADLAWSEMKALDHSDPRFDLFYLSYKEVRHGAPKQFISRNVFRPERGLWYLSGYVISKKGAQALLDLLPCKGPIDLWINQRFQEIDVRASRRSVIHQRRDFASTNSYSILPMLSGIGVIDSGNAALFQRKTIHSPVFVFGSEGTRLSALAMALSMLGYRCCSDLDRISETELKSLLTGGNDSIFNAYINIGVLALHAESLVNQFPKAKFVVLVDEEKTNNSQIGRVLSELSQADLLKISKEDANSWRLLCEHLQLAPPNMAYPIVPDIGQRTLLQSPVNTPTSRFAKRLRYDQSPWIVNPRNGWTGIEVSEAVPAKSASSKRLRFEDDFSELSPSRWGVRTDTFPGNLGLFRQTNVTPCPSGGISLTVNEEKLGVRDFSAGAISSQEKFLFGRFEISLQATSVSGLVTGFFLHRDSPRQEIDIEIAGNRPDQMLINVFYCPGPEGAKFDYGYRGTPVRIPLGFDASLSLHRYAIEWRTNEILWFVDEKLVYRRVIWDPTPIPDLPMKLHANTWPTRSRELAGKLKNTKMPGSSTIGRISVDAMKIDAQKSSI